MHPLQLPNTVTVPLRMQCQLGAATTHALACCVVPGMAREMSANILQTLYPTVTVLLQKIRNSGRTLDESALREHLRATGVRASTPQAPPTQTLQQGYATHTRGHLSCVWHRACSYQQRPGRHWATPRHPAPAPASAPRHQPPAQAHAATLLAERTDARLVPTSTMSMPEPRPSRR